MAAAGGALWFYSEQVDLVDDPRIRTDQRLRDEYARNATGFYALLATSGALVATGVTLYLLSDADAAVPVQAVIAPGQVMLSGRF